ncbi:efflux RND transporter periplasmic adaptor subunit [Duganella qianjiadongensis]|uniref:Efflux RND transporter periplasmic adaptor subunit n=1 Tax=Duganella qianjiadongensis TaxID=2692176 RepID=A0ABW9VLA6_9BURK|nr:efflux RND transporter periplasmic adaptor subunit [Duganella qianjiadongensis]MYM39675.1 efflux RND transporter periplasmic adaptor subunit [Duganella qianjiadongensis]
MNQKKNITRTAIVALVIAVAGAGGYWAGARQETHGATQPATGGPGGQIDPATGKKVLYWHDPMVPGPKFDKPGKSPFMDMQLVPMFADESGDNGKVLVSPRVQQNLGIRTADVVEGTLSSTLEVVGSVAYNERDVAVVQARASGYVERLYVRAPLDRVRKGQPLAELYVPDWVAAQEEYFAARRMQGAQDLADAALQRMRLAGMNEEQIRLVTSAGKVHPRITINAPVSGVVDELAAREGLTVAAGAPLYRINGLSTVWIIAEIPEAATGQVRPGAAVAARTPAWPGQTFQGKVESLLPEINAATRTLKARIELANPGERLAPGMFANISLTPATGQRSLLVPSEAVIQTGTRNVVFVAAGDGKFTPVNVEIGAQAGNQIEIRQGLQAGQKVVVSGQFLVDSEASLKGTIARMVDASASAPQTNRPPAETSHRGTGRVEKIGPEGVTLSHGPIPSLHWGPMTMAFKPPSGGLPRNVAVGDTVAFEVRKVQDGYQLTAVTPVTDSAPAAMKPGAMPPAMDKASMGGKR